MELTAFTDDARQVIIWGQEVAREVDNPEVDETHLLIGLWGADTPAAQALSGVGLRQPDLQRLITPSGWFRPCPTRPVFSDGAAEAVTGARVHATIQRSHEITSTHLATALLDSARVEDLLTRCGVDIAVARASLAAEVSGR